MTLPEKITKWGQAALVSAAVFTLATTIVVKVYAVISSGPEAKAKAISLDRRVTRLERKSKFVVRALEKLTGDKYDWKREDLELAGADQ